MAILTLPLAPFAALITMCVSVSGFILSAKGQQQGFPRALQLAALALCNSSLMVHINNDSKNTLTSLMPPSRILNSK